MVDFVVGQQHFEAFWSRRVRCHCSRGSQRSIDVPAVLALDVDLPRYWR